MPQNKVEHMSVEEEMEMGNGLESSKVYGTICGIRHDWDTGVQYPFCIFGVGVMGCEGFANSERHGLSYRAFLSWGMDGVHIVSDWAVSLYG